MQKIISRIFGIMALFICLCFAVNAFAGDKATKEECVAKCKEAAALVKEIGFDATMAKINDPKGPFVWKDSYVFCIDTESGIILAHLNPKMLGRPMKGLKDVNGKLFFVEFINVAKEKGEGWVDYMWPKPGEKEPSKKSSYVLKVDGHNILMGAGINE
ncbi:MAG: cache domain-containing protein [Desulfamplus sp.]|nr:cache domain-containing protein [Desulfamplus sp.]MBF0411660.1 cache domain-containing protein [Desulfamplus sp.]